VRVRGVGHFTIDGTLRRVDPVEFLTLVGSGESDAGRPIWQIALELAAQVPRDEAAKLPHLAENVDHYLYGAPKRR
jgi:hypothetical protein